MSSVVTQSLTEEEIDRFIQSLDHNQDGKISFDELERQLDHAFEELKPHMGRKRENDIEAEIDERKANQQRRAFIRSMLGKENASSSSIPIEQFKERIREWKIPSLEQEKQKQKEEGNYLNKASLRRKLYAWWSVVGPEYMFLTIVISLQLG